MNKTSSTISLPFVHDLSDRQLVQLQADSAKCRGLPVTFQDDLITGEAGPELVVIPPGVYEMGSDKKEFGHSPEESPQRYRHIRHAFAIGKFTVTAEQFALFESQTGWQWRPDLVHLKESFPVININAEQASGYTAWLSEVTGKTYRLPTEAEWEYAARCGSRTSFSQGDYVSCRDVHFNAAFPLQKKADNRFLRFLPRCFPLPKSLMVGSLPANLWGLHEMHGNVWELTASRWTDSHSSLRGREGPDQLSQCEWLVTKGGSWFDPAVKARSAARMPRMRDELDVNLGFRQLREID